jgi:hypothetical protein
MPDDALVFGNSVSARSAGVVIRVLLWPMVEDGSEAPTLARWHFFLLQEFLWSSTLMQGEGVRPGDWSGFPRPT